jgi:serine/threonine protein kinase
LWFVDVEPERGQPAAAALALATAAPAAALLLGAGALPHLHPSEATATATTTTTTASTTRSPLVLPTSSPLPSSSSLLPEPARFSSEAAPGLPPSLQGLVLGPPLASGSHGRVFRGRFRASERVAVKVLDAADVHRLDASTGAALEASLGERLRHPFVVQTLAWGVVGDPATALPARPRAWTRVAVAAKSSGGARGSGGSGSASGGTGANGSGGGGRAMAAVVRHGELLFPEDGSEVEDEDNQEEDSGDSKQQPSRPNRRANPQTWLVLELCELGSLQEAVDAGSLRTSRDPLNSAPHLPAILATAREIAAGMAYLHSEGVVHADLSAWNVLLSSAGHTCALGGRGWCAKIGDFGLARFFGGGGRGNGGDSDGNGSQGQSSQSNTLSLEGDSSGENNSSATTSALTTSTHGTVTHCAPELLARGELSPAADVFAFGVCLWQMWTGARPWHGLTHAQIVQAVAVEGKTLAWPQDAPEGLAAVGEACLSHHPSDRPTFADIVDVLAPLAEVLEASAAENP